MTHTLDPRTTWWLWQPVQTRLTKWTLALLQGRRYTIRLETTGTGYHDAHRRIIQANPQLFPEESPPEQFTLTQGILAHEVGHALFTDAWPARPQIGALRWLVNACEDQRIERAIAIFYPGVTPALERLGDLIYRQAPGGSGPAPYKVLAACLYWRWASARTGQSEMAGRLKLDADALALWMVVRPLVEAAWSAGNTGEVIDLSSQILTLLRLPLEGPLPEWLQEQTGPTGLSDVPTERGPDGPALPFPCGRADGPQPGSGLPGKGQDELYRPARADRVSYPAPYQALEARAWPLAARLSMSLRLPAPEVRPLPHEWLGRYSFRQELRTPDEPCLYRWAVDEDPRSLAVYLLIDRSGSMSTINPEVRLAAFSLYLAATSLGIPTGVGFFGADNDSDPGEFTMPVIPCLPRADETAKALIAGYCGLTAFEFLDWGLAMAEEALLARRERHRLLITLHDGEPVYEGRHGKDWLLSLQRLRRLEKHCIPIGVYLGDDQAEMEQLRMLFPRLVQSRGDNLPETLGNLLRSLA
jgi:hypothetical protein